MVGSMTKQAFYLAVTSGDAYHPRKTAAASLGGIGMGRGERSYIFVVSGVQPAHAAIGSTLYW